MHTPSTRLKKPLQIWLARIIGFGIVLGYTWINVSSIVNYERFVQDGTVRDVNYKKDENGRFIVNYVSSEAARNSIAKGDLLLNPEDLDSFGAIGSEVTLQFQRENLPPQGVTFRRQSRDFVVYGGGQIGLSPITSTRLALFFAIFPTFVSVLSALLLLWLRSDDWMVFLTILMLVSYHAPPSQVPWIRTFQLSDNILLFLWLILFPHGKLDPRGSWVPILFIVPPRVTFNLLTTRGILPQTAATLSLDTYLTIISAIAILAIFAIMIYRYRRVFSPVERQQSKWIVIQVIVLALTIMIFDVFYRIYYYSQQYEIFGVAYFIITAIRSFFIPVLVIGILFSVFRYRLYDVDLLVSRALVYSSLTGILGVVGIVVTTLINSIPQQILGNQSGLLGLVVSALPIAALFNPVREGLQRIVDRYFKPEEVDFENTFIEFTPELSSFFTTGELSTLLSDQAVEQLAVSYASVFLNEESGDLKHIKTTALDAEAPEPVLEPKTIETIRSGRLAVPEGDSARSLVVPLVVPRTRKPSLMGALVLGPRSQGLGYSTEMQKGLKKFGEVVGKAFYVAELKSRRKGNT
jgi:hypothetical protein